MMRKKLYLLCLLPALVVMSCKQQGQQTQMAAPESEAEKLNYSVGRMIGKSLQRDIKQDEDFKLDSAYLAKGIEDALSDASPLMSEEDINITMQAYTKRIQEKMAVANAGSNSGAGEAGGAKRTNGEKNMKDGKAFLQDNKKNEGIVETKSGLQYKVITAGSGAKPKADSEVEVHYRGTLIDGTEFDSSYKRGEPISFKLNQVIAGWQEGLQLMSKGAKWQLFIPSNLAYGERGAGPIGPNETLVFDVELLDIK